MQLVDVRSIFLVEYEQKTLGNDIYNFLLDPWHERVRVEKKVGNFIRCTFVKSTQQDSSVSMGLSNLRVVVAYY